MRRCSLIAAIVLCASLAAPVAGAAQESRTANIDVVLLVDKSLSMSNIDVSVSGAKDTSGQTQTARTVADGQAISPNPTHARTVSLFFAII